MYSLYFLSCPTPSSCLRIKVIFEGIMCFSLLEKLFEPRELSGLKPCISFDSVRHWPALLSPDTFIVCKISRAVSISIISRLANHEKIVQSKGSLRDEGDSFKISYNRSSEYSESTQRYSQNA